MVLGCSSQGTSITLLFYEQFSDSWFERMKEYPLNEVLRFIFFTIISGYTGWKATKDVGEGKL